MNSPGRSPAPTARTRGGPLGALPRLSSAARRALVVCAVLAALNGIALVVQAWALAWLLGDAVTVHSGPSGVALWLLAGAVVGRAGLGWAIRVAAARAAAGAKEELRARALDGALARGPEWIAAHGPGELTSLCTKGLDALDEYFAVYLPALVTAAVVPLGVGGVILLADWPSALVIAVTVPLIPLFAILVGKYTEDRVGRAASATQRLSGHLLEMVRALPVLTAFRRAAAQGEAVRRTSDGHRRATLSTLRIAFSSALVLELVATLSVALVAVLIGVRLVSGDLELAVGLFVLILAPECYLPLRAAGAAHHASEDGLEAVRRVQEIRQNPSSTSDPRENPAPHPVPGGDPEPSVPGHDDRQGASPEAVDNPIVVDNPTVVDVRLAGCPDGVAPRTVRVEGLRVDRRGGQKPDGLSFTVRPGEITRLDSPSGSGKSTAIAVLLGFVEPAAGTVRVAGVDLSTVDIRVWRRNIAWVPQRPAFSAATVTDELRLAIADQSGPPASDDELGTIARDVGAEHLLHRTIVELSTGERQRVAIARAMLRIRHGATVLLLDEPTAHLDDATAGKVMAAVRRATADGVAVLLATHRERPADDSASDSPQWTTQLSTSDDVSPGKPPRLGGRALAGATLAAATALCGIALTATSAWLIAKASGQPPMLTLTVAVVGVRAFGLARAGLRYVERLVTHDAAFRDATDGRVRLWHALVRLGPARTSTLRRGEGLRRLVDDVDAIRDLTPRVLVPPVVAAAVCVAAVIVSAAVLPEAGLVLAGACLIAGLAGPALTAVTERRATAAVATLRRDVSAGVLGLLDAAPDLIATGADRVRRAELTRTDDELAARARRQAFGAGAGEALITLVLGAATLISTWIAVVKVTGGVLTPELAPVVALVPLAMIEVLSVLPAARRNRVPLRAAHGRVAELLRPPPAERRQLEDSHDVVLSGVDVCWPGDRKPLLHNVNLAVPAGSRVAVVGPSGAGKSTLLALLLGFLAPERGEARAPHKVAWSPQDPQLVSTTVRENLRLGDPEASDATMIEALCLAGLPHWSARLDVRLDAGGAGVSGGEAQRLGLARALLGARNADLVLLDEPTAHLDVPTARTVLGLLGHALEGKTVVHVTHRLDEVTGADLVLRVTDGRVIEVSPVAAAG
ncbi:ATP-binding cassette subfamily C protein CydCD [Herbihabitans rhizosphaerae]|uniref:ATP-binding cassette subfamily C protein CydCD n=1 Tax=Herbihabitans rhizosphaerae TaxID=1872711 RepID=A0A4Q7L759_9PSEU|nr:thiol reductant ABC exporter subunit CydD [Herbihabitans rhizosphaerae]RZS45225.1 ATP-binding cassette subfamily C protein CydCD [Herbihabitans rhizosphaerae]